MITGKSIYHPLIYGYRSISWLICQKTSSVNCHSNRLLPQQVSGNQGVVVTSQHKATEIGLNILKQGGNAIDAAVAVGYALAVSDPCCGNIGGGGFMLIRRSNGEEVFINFREKAPLLAHSKMYLNDEGNIIKDLSKNGYLAVAVPGSVKGLNYALSTYGTMDLSTVMKPAIELATQGFRLQPGDVEILKAGEAKFKDSHVKSIFLNHQNKSLKVGDLLIQKNLAKTLQLIANSEGKEFYQGEIAQKIVQASNENGGILTQEDFAQYQIEERAPIKCNYRGYEVISSPPPGGGTTLCQMLNILSGYQFLQLNHNSLKSTHLMLSAMFLAYNDRNIYLGDPNFVDIPLEKLLSQEYANKLRQQIQNKAISPGKRSSRNVSEGINTTHYSIIDREGNAVAVTYTINSYFGAGVMAKDTGFFLNNEMNDFTTKLGVPNQFGLVQGNANKIEPMKHPLSSMSPTIVTKNGEIFLITGSPGGSTIPTTVLQVIVNMIDYKMSLAQALSAPKFHYQGFPPVVITEPFAFKSKTYQQLWQKGYRVIPFPSWGAAASIQMNQSRHLLGVSDPRKSAGKSLAY